MHYKQRCHFYIICSLCLKVVELIWRKCYKNVSNENYAKLVNYLSKMKELDQIVLQKVLFTSIKGHLCLTKGHLDSTERQLVVEFPLIGSYF